MSETPPFSYSRPTLVATKTVYDLVPCGNEFEQAFAKFLEDALDVERFAKLPEQFGFAIEYTDTHNNLRYYEPDFVAVLTDGTHHLIETKGREDVDVANKDRAATLWCEYATRLTGNHWQYVKVPQKDYEKLQPYQFSITERVYCGGQVAIRKLEKRLPSPTGQGSLYSRSSSADGATGGLTTAPDS